MSSVAANPSVVGNAPATPAPGSIAEAVVTPEPKKGDKVLHPSLEDGKTIEVEPEDFNTGKHQPLKQESFTKPHMYYTWKGNGLIEAGKKLLIRADAHLKTANFKDHKTAQKVMEMKAEQARLIAQLKAAGEDVSAFE